jgi:hypothetical protein
LKPWVKKRGHIYFVATLKEFRRECDSADGDAMLSGLLLQKPSDAFSPGLPKRNPGLIRYKNLNSQSGATPILTGPDSSAMLIMLCV